MFNTEAHPIDMASLYCCSSEKVQHVEEVEKILSHVDLLRMIGVHGEREHVVRRKPKNEVLETHNERLEREKENCENLETSGDEGDADEEEKVTDSDEANGNFITDYS